MLIAEVVSLITEFFSIYLDTSGTRDFESVISDWILYPPHKRRPLYVIKTHRGLSCQCTCYTVLETITVYADDVYCADCWCVPTYNLHVSDSTFLLAILIIKIIYADVCEYIIIMNRAVHLGQRTVYLRVETGKAGADISGCVKDTVRLGFLF